MSKDRLPSGQDPHHSGDRKELTRGAGLALLGRFGALIEVVSLPLLLWLYGAVMFGVFATLYAVVRIAVSLTQMGMNTALQRFLPALKNENEIHQAVATAIILPGMVSVAGAVAIVAAAPQLQAFAYGVDEPGGTRIATVIRFYAWMLPLWTMVEILTACVRAQRKFGPEIRVRFFYEQILRILFAVVFAMAGLTTFGLFAAHIFSMTAAMVMSLLLLRRFFRLPAIVSAGFNAALTRRMLNFALPLMLTTLIQRLFSELPVVTLNLLLPGATGAATAGYYSIARKISSVLQVIYNSFDYVLAPLAAYRAGATGPASIADMYFYTTRLMITVGVVAGSVIIAARHGLHLVLGQEAAPVLAALVILVAGRVMTFVFGQAPVMIRTLNSGYWPMINGLLGLGLMSGLLFVFIDPAAGASESIRMAAIAASSGMVLAAVLAAVEVAWLHRMVPYTRGLLRPLGVALLLAGAILLLGETVRELPAWIQFTALVPVFFLAMAGLLRYGLSEEDASPFGRLAWLLR